MAKIAICKLKSAGPYMQSKHIDEPIKDREDHEDYETRTWKGRCHVNGDGKVLIPAAQFSNSLKNAAKYLSIKIKGQGQAKYTAKFKAGTMVIDDLVLPLDIEDVKGSWKFVPSNGESGGGKRVNRCFPEIPAWEGDVTYYILDEIITEDVFRRVLTASGALVGIGMYRPMNGGTFGRFSVQDIEWSDYNV